MKEYLIQLAGYNEWANAQSGAWLLDLSEDQWQQTQAGASFGTIAATVLHLAWAEKLWHQRVVADTFSVAVPDAKTNSKAMLIDLWKLTSSTLKNCIEQFDENQLSEKMEYRKNDGNLYALKYYQVFVHVFNHATFHRGQLITMLRQSGFTNITSTDMSSFFTK